MRRRSYLVISSGVLAGLAGCGGGSSDIEDSGATQTGNDDGNTGNAGGDQQTESTDQSTEADVEFGERELLRDDSGYSTQVYAQVMVENVGDGTAGRTTVNVSWYDSDGNYIEETSSQLPGLEAGEVWVAQVAALASDSDNIADFEINGEYETAPPETPSGMEVSQSSLEVEEFTSKITGVAANNRDDEMGYVEAQGKIYDDQGRAIGGGWTNETDIPAGEDWAFEIPLSGRAAARAADAADHEAFLAAEGLI